MQPFDHVVEIVALHPDVAVGHDDDLVGDRARHVDQVGDLAVLPVDAAVHHQTDVAVRIGALERAHDRDRSVGGVVDAEHDLHRAGVVLIAEALQVLAQAVLGPVQRLQEGDGRGEGCGHGAARAGHVGEGEPGGHHGEDRAAKGQDQQGRT